MSVEQRMDPPILEVVEVSVAYDFEDRSMLLRRCGNARHRVVIRTQHFHLETHAVDVLVKLLEHSFGMRCETRNLLQPRLVELPFDCSQLE